MRTINRIKTPVLTLLLTIVALMVGQGAWAKTVAYRIANATQNGTSYTLTFGLADGTPFDGSSTYSSITVNTSTATDQTVTLGDGFSLRLQWEAGTNVIIHDSGYGWEINSTSGYVTYTVACASGRYFATHLEMKNNEGSQRMLDTENHAINPDFDYAYQLSQSYNSSQGFGRLVITYTDAPPISLLTSPSDNTYNITSKRDLAVLAGYVNGGKHDCTGLTFQQMNNITCDATYTPIGYYLGTNNQASFHGTYDGQGYTISGITVNRTGNTDADNLVGLFGYVYYKSSSDYGTVRNVVLASSTFTGYDKVGGIVGYNSGGIVENCRVESTVTINASTNKARSHGGIVGENWGTAAKVIGCYSAAAVSSNGKSSCQQFGGIVGYNYRGTVKDCLYAGTTVTADNKKGAIVGEDRLNEGTFTNNYYTAIDLGGVGADGSSSDQTGACRARTITLGTNIALSGARTVYSASRLTAIGATALQGGSTLYSGEGQTLTLNYTGEVPLGYQPTYSATAGSISGNALTMAAADVTVSSALGVKDFADDGHSGNSEADAYIIYIKEQLDMLATRVNAGGGHAYFEKFIKLANDITYDGTENNYTPIGNNSGQYSFEGTFDGDGHTVSGININSSNNNQGLFGHVSSSGTVKNVTLANSTITGNNYVGGIVGYNYGTVENCRVESTVTINAYAKENDSHGGIVGYCEYGTVDGCISSATVSSNGKSYCYRYGAIVGGNDEDGTIRNCLAIGATVSSLNQIGAIVGLNSGTLANNYYYNCTVNGATTNVGTYGSDVSANDGAVQAAQVLTANQADGNYWTTYYSGTNDYRIATGNAYAYTAQYDGENSQLTLTKLGQSIPSATAVIIAANNGNDVYSTSHVVLMDDDVADFSGTNDLHGVDVRTPKSELGTGTFYVMGKKGGEFGFFEYTAEYMPAHKAYLLVSGGTALARGLTMVFDDDEASGISTMSDVRSERPEASRWSSPFRL